MFDRTKLRDFIPFMNSFRLGPRITLGVKYLLMINIAVYLFQLLSSNSLLIIFGLIPGAVIEGYIWQLFTYQFLHGSFMHIFF